jgi:hypothetical protein
MNKLAFTLMLALAPAARAAEIASIDCLASNGVILKGTSEAGQALKINTQWGLFSEEFTATIGDASTADTTYVNLDSKTGEHYVLALDASTTRTSEVQKTSGTILQPSTVRGVQPAVVAYVRCELSLR